MMPYRLAFSLAALSLLAAPLPAQQPRAEPPVTAFVDVSVIPMDRERVLLNQTVVVQGGHIVALGPSTRISAPKGAVRVDGRGKFLLPGFGDMHAHLSAVNLATAQRADRLRQKEQQLFLWLAHGVTTARVLDHYDHGGRDREILELRDRQAAGELLSPRIVAAGDFRSRLPGPDTAVRYPTQLSEVAAAVTNYKAAGFDLIKAYPGQTIPNALPPDSVMFDSLAATARRVGLPLAGHTTVPLAQAFRTYQSIEHLGGYITSWGYPPVLTDSLLQHLPPDSLAARIREVAVATQRAGVWNCPTLYNEYLNQTMSTPMGMGNMRLLVGSRQLVKALQEAGAGLLAGSDRLQYPQHGGELLTLLNLTDSSLQATQFQASGVTRGQALLELVHGYPGATHEEFRTLVEDAGLTPYQALATGTRNVAAYLGALDSTGTIAVGKRADLVLLAGNPLADIRQTTRIAGVMLGGRWLDRAALDRRTAAIRGWLERRCTATASGADTTGPSLCELLPAEWMHWVNRLKRETR